MNEEIEYNVGDKVYYSKVEYGEHTIEKIMGFEVLLSCPKLIGSGLDKFWTTRERIFLIEPEIRKKALTWWKSLSPGKQQTLQHNYFPDYDFMVIAKSGSMIQKIFENEIL